MNRELHDLLTELQGRDKLQGGEWRRLQKLEAQRQGLELRLGQLEKRVQDFHRDRQLLMQLAQRMSLSAVLNAAKPTHGLLGGEIDFDSPRQKRAFQELVQTLKHDGEVEEPHLSLMRAMLEYYVDYFGAGSGPEAELKTAREALAAFDADPEGGANREYREFKIYLQGLEDFENGRAAELPARRPAWHITLHLNVMEGSQDKDFKAAMLSLTSWESCDVPALAKVLRGDGGLLRRMFERLDQLQVELDARWLDRELSGKNFRQAWDNHRFEWDEMERSRLLDEARSLRLPNLFAALADHCAGAYADAGSLLKDASLDPHFFVKIFCGLYRGNPSRLSYGVDCQQALRWQQRFIDHPDCALRIFQRASPRGVDGASLIGLGESIRALNVRHAVGMEKRSLYEEGLRAKDMTYMQLMERYYQIDALRTMIMLFIHDALIGGGWEKLGEDEQVSLIELLMLQEKFEMATGGNSRILSMARAAVGAHPLYRTGEASAVPA